MSAFDSSCHQSLLSISDLKNLAEKSADKKTDDRWVTDSLSVSGNNNQYIFYIDVIDRVWPLKQQKERLPNIIKEIRFSVNKIQFDLTRFVEFAYWALLSDVL